MSSIYDCIQRAVDAKELNPIQGRAAQNQFNQLVDRYEKIMPVAQAQAKAAEDLKEATRRAARSRFHAVVNQLQAMRRLKHSVETAPDPAAALRNLLEWSEGSGFSGESVRSLTEAYTQSINAGLNDVLRSTGRNLVGNSRDPVLLEKLIAELHGDQTGNQAAKALADAVRYQQRRMRQAFNSFGGDVGELADYGVPHAHSADEIRRAGFDAWADEIEQRLDWSKITDASTGKPFAAHPGVRPSRTDTARMLQDVYDGITTHGWDDRAPAMSVGGKALYNQRAEHRALHFKSGADWIDYNKRFGAADPFSAMLNGLHGLARDVAMMRVLGPNPRGGLEFAIQTAQKRASVAGDAELEARVSGQSSLARTMFDHMTGATSVPEHIGMAQFFGGIRGGLASIQLGSAVLSSFSDPVTIAVAARIVGMNPANIATRTVKLMASEATRETAARMGYVAQTLAEAGSGSARYFGGLLGTGLGERLSGFTLRASGLNFVTDMRRIAFQTEFAGFLADHASRDFADLPDQLRAMFEGRGIAAADWDRLRDPAVRFVSPDGADFIAPTWWLEHQTAMPRAEAEGLSMRLQMMINEQLEFAVPTTSIEGRARIIGGTKPGTVSGEFLRSVGGYKNFSLSLMLNQYRRFMARPTPMSKATYAASMSVPLLLAGAFAIQLKELSKGNDPRPMTDGKFWLAALLQGGGLGIFGDFFAAEQSRAGGGLGETLAGPVVGFLGDIVGPFSSNITAAVAGKDTHWGRDLSSLVRYNTPVGSSLWYARAGYDRLVADTLQSFLDPDAEAQWRRQAAQREREYGTRSWWDRGAAVPSRGPDLGNVLRESGE